MIYVHRRQHHVLRPEKYDLGAWIFFAGSLLYLLVTGHDLVEVIAYRHRLDRPPKHLAPAAPIAAVTYFTGTILFAIGSVFFRCVPVPPRCMVLCHRQPAVVGAPSTSCRSLPRRT
ncbi:MAG: hypothetical protein R3D03_11190 [Geminicoccaceae bacterium]